jgi:hypothetical protein
MAIIRKTNPVGIDKPIDRLQNYLYNSLAWANYESYHRAYTNEKNGIKIPEIYTSNGEYKNVFYNDNFDATSFFIIDENRDTETVNRVDLSLIYQVDLTKIKPAITHRADEEVLNEISFYLKRNSYGFDLTNVKTGISNVYSGLNLEMPKGDDISNRFVARFDLVTNYEITCP